MAFRNGKSSCLCEPSGGSGGNDFADLRLDIAPSGAIDGVNLTFVTPEKFVQAPPLVIRVYRNGQRQDLGGDYTVSESGGFGTGYDTIDFVTGAKVKPGFVVTVDYIAA